MIRRQQLLTHCFQVFLLYQAVVLLLEKKCAIVRWPCAITAYNCDLPFSILHRQMLHLLNGVL